MNIGHVLKVDLCGEIQGITDSLPVP